MSRRTHGTTSDGSVVREEANREGPNKLVVWPDLIHGRVADQIFCGAVQALRLHNVCKHTCTENEQVCVRECVSECV